MITDLRKRAPSGASKPTARALLALGFRPFFLVAGVFAATVVPLWLLAFSGVVALPTSLPPSAWHGHEMVFGFVVAVVAGFLLTAVGNWTGEAMPSGRPLAVLALVWLAGRVGVVLSGIIPAGLAAAMDLVFVPLLAWTIARPLLRAKNWRNVGLLVPLAVLFGANLLFHVGPPGTLSRALRLAIHAVVLLIVVIGGRVVPSFTENALRVTIVRRVVLDWGALVSVGLVAVLDATAAPPAWTGAAGIIAGVLNGARGLGWKPVAARAYPILWVLHLGYAWIALGLLLSGVSVFVPSWPATAPLHALTVGGIGLMILGMITRVGLGHTGRMLTVSRPIAFAYALLALAAALRTFGPLLVPGAYLSEIIGSGVLWTLAFGLFVATYLPILTKPRLDQKPG